MDTSRRVYRSSMSSGDRVTFECKVKETDLFVAVDGDSFSEDLPALVEKRVLYYRVLLEDYIKKDPDFACTLQPHLLAAEAPPMALAMVRAGNMAGVGPMAAVAGAFAEFVGLDLLKRVKQVTVENGGDIFLKTDDAARILVLAGDSPLSGKLALELPPSKDPYGVCTSSGTVGPSLSLGRADAAVIVSPSAPLADAVATAAANRVQTVGDLAAAVEFASSVPGVTGVVLIKDDKLAAWGNLKLVPA